jgi:hypothetical protein
MFILLVEVHEMGFGSIIWITLIGGMFYLMMRKGDAVVDIPTAGDMVMGRIPISLGTRIIMEMVMRRAAIE